MLNILNEIFIQVLSHSIIGSYLILIVIIARFILKKAYKSYSYALWGVVFIRLLLPISIESEIAIFPSN